MELRQAQRSDIEAIEALIERSVMELMRPDYDAEALRASVGALFGVDRQIIDDQTYYVVSHQSKIVAAGGWSFRHVLFGGDAAAERNQRRADPEHDAAHIRAYYVDPNHARSGLGTLLLQRSEMDARNAGFRCLALGATLTGMPFYERHGYLKGDRIAFTLPGGISFPLQLMSKSLARPPPDTRSQHFDAE